MLTSSIFKGNILGGGISIENLGTPERIKLFEGWFDFLSYLKLSGATDFKAIILNSTANLSFRLMLDILKECGTIDLYLDNDATGNKCTSNFIKVAEIYRYCLENGMDTDWDLKALRGRSRDKIGKLITSLGIKPVKVEKVWKNKTTVSDQRSYYDGFEDVSAFLIESILD